MGFQKPVPVNDNAEGGEEKTEEEEEEGEAEGETEKTEKPVKTQRISVEWAVAAK